MCQNIALAEETNELRDNCINCFTTASRANNNQPRITEIADCAELYLTDTRYDRCVLEITSATQFNNGDCVAGYCDFVRCIRRVNSDLLIANCYASASEDNTAELEEDQVTLYKNITSCILAVTRCSRINPITGQPQTNRISITTKDKWGKPITTTLPLYNSLQINRAGDLRIVAFPGNTKIASYFCAYEFNLRESTWLNYTC
ncbi:unnamed protein product [Brassicogethes aeneus]|uniref:Uncharacterized protein n=1 Tax=Brassicogethes aeneus TaxID=1431903 RepID=A0A9P0BFJ9_BRAAE|nr:unnamed protein product [Brassicogethes aeneus]